MGQYVYEQLIPITQGASTYFPKLFVDNPIFFKFDVIGDSFINSHEMLVPVKEGNIVYFNEKEIKYGKFIHLVYTSMPEENGEYYYTIDSNTSSNQGIILKHNGLIYTIGADSTWVEDEYKVKIYPDYVDNQTAVYSNFDPDALYLIGTFALRGVVSPTAKFLRIGSLVFPQIPSSISYQEGDTAFIVSWPGGICDSVRKVCDGGSVDMELMESLGNVGGVLIVRISEGVNSVYFKDSYHGSVMLTPFAARLYLLNIDYKKDSSFTITVDYALASQKYISKAVKYSNGDAFADNGTIDGKNAQFSNVGIESETWTFIDITLSSKS